ncbi:PilZ domain-containing protein [Thiogranum longum]|uniref:PilZ domain-containing protein n=1 Tax=Thiogranum longum TaxID=1537524 RepID=A0A4R1H9J5_9GAMM|nr:PilZ domain-containing protein [Thiogranum longum]TCK17968.1 PilZ domain-containing protein [Thiogranum longum]
MNNETNIKDDEQRRLTRVSIPEHPQIFDVNNNTVAGQLVNLSIEGLMMMSPSPVNPGTLLQFRIPLQCCESVVDILVGVESLWCDDTDESGVCWTGFHIIDISSEHLEIISTLVYD